MSTININMKATVAYPTIKRLLIHMFYVTDLPELLKSHGSCDEEGATTQDRWLSQLASLVQVEFNVDSGREELTKLDN